MKDVSIVFNPLSHKRMLKCRQFLNEYLVRVWIEEFYTSSSAFGKKWIEEKDYEKLSPAVKTRILRAYCKHNRKDIQGSFRI